MESREGEYMNEIIGKGSLRIDEHPVLGREEDRRKISFFFNGEQLSACRGDTIAAALTALGIRVFRYTRKEGSPRGIFCGIGQCTDCLVQVNGVPNVRSCITELEEGMRVEQQSGTGRLHRREDSDG
jgi:predicted molibdopterin-dependent oxidoreductase YjgC